MAEIKPEITWRNNGVSSDDFIFEHGKYCLRCERMDVRAWWWDVDFDGETIAGVDRWFLSTKAKAQKAAEKVFLEHLEKEVDKC